MEITMVTRLGICVTAILGLIIAAMIFAIFDLYNKLKKCQDKLEEHNNLLLDLKGIVIDLQDHDLNIANELISIRKDIEEINNILNIQMDISNDTVSRLEDLERAYACLADSQESLDDAMIDLEKYHDELVDFVMEVREDVQYCKAKMKSQKRYCKKCKKSSGIDCENIWREIDGLKLRLEGHNAENTWSANG